MKPIRTPHTTRILGAPEDWDYQAYGECVGLHIAELGDIKLSYWKTTWRDRLSILFGRPVRLAVFAESHPPVMLDTEKV